MSDVANNQDEINSWRARWLCVQANRLDKQADELRRSAQEYREQARKLCPPLSDELI